MELAELSIVRPAWGVELVERTQRQTLPMASSSLFVLPKDLQASRSIVSMVGRTERATVPAAAWLVERRGPAAAAASASSRGGAALGEGATTNRVAEQRRMTVFRKEA